MLVEHRDDDQRAALDRRLGIGDDDDRLADDVPTAKDDPAALAALAAFGEATYE